MAADTSPRADAVQRFRARRRLPERIVGWSLYRPRRILLGWSVLLGLAVLGIARVEIDTRTDGVLDRADPAWAFHKYSQELFGGEEILVVAIESEEPFGEAALAEVSRLSRVFERLPDVRRVDSLDTVPMIRARSDGTLILDPALAEGAPANGQERDLLQSEVMADRIAPRNLVSADGRTFAVNLVLDADADGHFVEMVDTARRETEQESGWVSGVPVFRRDVNERTTREVLSFLPLTLLVIGGFLWGIFRSHWAVVLALSGGLVGSGLMVGIMGALGARITLVSMILPSVMLAFGCAYAMHLLNAAQGKEDLEELRGALARVSLPVALSGLTTAIGFASIASVRVDIVRESGAYGAVGVLGTLAGTMTLVPALLGLRRLPALRPRFAAALESRAARWLLDLVTRRRALVLTLWVAFVLPLGLGLTRLDVVTDVINWFPHGTPARDDYEAIRDRLAGISPINVVVETSNGRRVTEPEIVDALDRLDAHLESLPMVGKVVSLADPLRQIHGGFNDDDSQPLPDDEALIEQYLLLLDSVEQLDDLVTGNRQAANVMLRVDDNRSGVLRQVAAEAEAWWARYGPEDFSARSTGTMFEFARSEDEISFGQLRGLSIAVVAIALVLLVVFRRPSLAAAALVPNAVPVLGAFGFMGLVGIPLDAGTVMLGSLALGIAVDDTMHVVTSFQEARARGASSEAALRAAIRPNLPALTYTTVGISVGFGLLGFSEFTFTRNLGLLVSGIMGVCLLADVTLLPALLYRGARATDVAALDDASNGSAEAA